MPRVYVNEGAALKRGLKELGKTQCWLKERLDRKRQGKLSVCQNTIWGYCNNRNMPIETWEEIRTHIFSPERKKQDKAAEKRIYDQEISTKQKAKDRRSRMLESEQRREQIKNLLNYIDKNMRWLANAINRPYNTVKGWLSGKRFISLEDFQLMKQVTEECLFQMFREQYETTVATNKIFLEHKTPLFICLAPDAYKRLEEEASMRGISVEKAATMALESKLRSHLPLPL